MKRLYDYWERTRGSRPMPERKDIDPVEMQFILGHIALIDIVPRPARFRVRLQGTEFVWWTGCDLTGRTLDALPLPDIRALADKCLGQVADSGVPWHGSERRMLDDRLRVFEALILPLAAEGDQATMLLAAVRCCQ